MRATKLVPELKDLPYEERLRQLHLSSLYYSRRRGDKIEMLGVELIDPDKFFKWPPSHSTRGHRYKIVKPNVFHYWRWSSVIASVCVTIDGWNRVPDAIFDVNSVNEFKASLDWHWMREQYTLPVWNDHNAHKPVNRQDQEPQAQPIYPTTFIHLYIYI